MVLFSTARRSDATVKLDALDRSQAIITFALDGTIVDANANFLGLMGYTLAETRGRHHRMFVDPVEAASQAYEAFWERLRRGEFQTAEYRRIAKGGREVWIRATYNPILDRSGKPVQIIKFALDVTAEKRAAAVTASQIAAIDQSQAVIHFDLDGTILDANANFLEATGYSRDEVIGRHHRMFAEPDDADSPAYAAFWDALNRGIYQSGEFRRLGKGGREVWIQATYNPILDPNGRPFRIVKYASDVTAAKRFAADMTGQVEAARRSQAVIEFDMDGIVLDANQNFLDALGYTLGEIRGQHHRLFVTPAYGASETYAAFWQNLRAGYFSSAVFQRVGKGGREVWIQASYNPVLDTSGRPVKVVKYAFDITKSMSVRANAINIAEQTLSKVQAVAADSDEMHRISASIAAQMERSREAVGDIHARMNAAGQLSTRLGEAAAAMNGVIETITAIAEQINLLALNATIEAARAGAAGRGFAVVASEVKSLAQQARAATSHVTGEIAAMQAISQEVGAALISTGRVVETVQGFIAQTAAASADQHLTTGQVSANMKATAESIAGIAGNLDEWIVGVEERRVDERKRVSLPARITVPSERGTAGAPSIACLVLNVSRTGAKIMTRSRSVPEAFLLSIEGGPQRRCQSVRRIGDEIGVRFL